MKIKSTISQRLKHLTLWPLIITTLIVFIGISMLYSNADGSWTPWAARQLIYYFIGLAVMLVISVIHIQFWIRTAYINYFICLCLLILVAVTGHIGMGAQRWLDLGIIKLQPSELMKISLIMALAKYFHNKSLNHVSDIFSLMTPLALVFTPALIVAKQPDLGTATFLVMLGGMAFWLAGVRVWKFITIIVLLIISFPILWLNLRVYQKERILNFLNPERDILGSGYHIMQSKIALGSGGFFGKGFMHGTQNHLGFLPEDHTDFIFASIGEEFGFLGSLVVISLFVILIFLCYTVALQSKNRYGSLVAGSIASMIFVYMIVNIGMVVGIMPVVGIPLPLISYGGTAMVTFFVALGFLHNIYIFRNIDDHHIK